jgi:hypothetical protein
MDKKINTAGSLWPVLNGSKKTPLKILWEQGEYLSKATGGAVSFEIDRFDHGKTWYAIYLVNANQTPKNRYFYFIVVCDEKPPIHYPVVVSLPREAFLGKGIVAKTEQQFLEALKNLFNATDTIDVVEYLRICKGNIHQGQHKEGFRL